MHSSKTPVRIARIIARLGVGGSERYVCSLAANLNPEKFRSWLICGRVGGDERQCSEFIDEAGIEPIYVDQLRRGLGPHDVSAAMRIRRLLGEIKPQIVETHTAKAGALGRTTAYLHGMMQHERPRIVHTFHGHVFNGYFRKPVTRAFVLIERQLARLTDMIVTVSPSVRRELVEEYRIADADKVRVVSLGLDFNWLDDLAAHRGWLRAKLAANDSTVIFGTIGRLAKVKNTELVIRAFARVVREERLDARLVIIGDGELVGALRALARDLSVDHLVLFCGWVLDRARIFSDLDVTCLSSFNEGSPVCLIESLAAGIPVVATEVGGVADVVCGRTDGELVESNNESAFAAAMSRMARAKRRIAAERRATVRAGYSVSRLVHNVESLYDELLANDRHPLADGRSRVQTAQS